MPEVTTQFWHLTGIANVPTAASEGNRQRDQRDPGRIRDLPKLAGQSDDDILERYRLTCLRLITLSASTDYVVLNRNASSSASGYDTPVSAPVRETRRRRL